MAKISKRGTYEVARVEKYREAKPNTYGFKGEDVVRVLRSDRIVLEKTRAYYVNEYHTPEWSPYKVAFKVKEEYATKDAWMAFELAHGWKESSLQGSSLNPPKAAPVREYFILSELTPEYQTAVKACYPTWTGRKLYAKNLTGSKRLDSYWDGGSRDTFRFYNTLTKETLAVHSNHPFFEADQPNTLRKLPSHILLLEHSIFRGKDGGITIYANPTPAPAALQPVSVG